MDASAAAPNFSFFALFMQADWVVKGVMIGLILASLGSWAVILDKLFRFNTLNRAADRFEEQVSGGRSLEDVAGEAGANPPHALPRMLQAALKEWRDAKARPMTENQTAFLVARIDRILDTMIARETAKVEEGLGSLAIVATASPFIGLFGTVWGIMHAFQNIALSKNTSLAVVAPSIAEALFATAVGLIAAIPAYIAYNKFSTDAGKYGGRLEGFADDLSTAIQRRLTER
ncbi:protein TolQ [uncultured Caulobacter sp.]|uniref:protein TolQ n=1 Tax=uncultured Caulobacter sp. TaxID=158749 RepID=UPI00262018FB|nr:protein TolQ [uncultured Caulobacter sp.]